MKKTSTLKNAELTETPVKHSDFSESSGNGMEPDDQVIQNILNYSKALEVRKSAWLGHLTNLNN